MGAEINKKIYLSAAVLMCIVIFFGAGYLLGVRNASSSRNGIRASESAGTAAAAADRAADRLDTAADEIRDAEEAADNISRTGAEIGSTLQDIERSGGQFETGLNDCAEIVDRCKERNQRIAEIIGGTAGTGADTGKRESDPSERK